MNFDKLFSTTPDIKTSVIIICTFSSIVPSEPGNRENFITPWPRNVWSVHFFATTGHPLWRARSTEISTVSWAEDVRPEPSWVLRYISWYPPEVLHIAGTDFIAQVVQTCYHTVTYASGKCSYIASLIHCIIPGATIYVSCISNSSIQLESEKGKSMN
jgi:hypothetical protein